jgi:hypothetical protein
MNSSGTTRSPRTLGLWARLACLIFTLAGCGGGVESGGTGISTASYANGPITGFGSVIVNGVRFDDSAASVADDAGNTRSRDDLRLGMTIEVRGSAILVDAAGTSVSTATSIAFRSEILGRVDSVNVAGNQLVVLGQGVDVTPATVFDNLSLTGGLAAINLADVVEVYGQYDVATGRYVATRIERKSGTVASFRLRGLVRNFDAISKSFSLGSERISYAAYAGTLPPNLANDNFVRVSLQTTPLAGVWQMLGATEGVQPPRDDDEVRLEGLISAFTSATVFSVNGLPVDASRITPLAGLAVGVRVEAEGTAQGGVLQATKLKIKTASDVADQTFDVRAPITSVDTANLSFVLRGITVVYSLTTTDFRNGTAANLAPNLNVEARGTLSADGTRLQATRIVFR